MRSFGRLLRRMRGTIPLGKIAQRIRREPQFLENIESGRVVPDERVARAILTRGFDLDADESRRAILGIQLYDLGLKDNDIRQLVIAVIEGSVPETTRASLKRHYRTLPQ